MLIPAGTGLHLQDNEEGGIITLVSQQKREGEG